MAALTSAQLKSYAAGIGVDPIGVTTAEPFDRYLRELDHRREHYVPRYEGRLATWRRMANPRQVLESAKAVVVIGFAYHGEEREARTDEGRFARIVSYGHLGILVRARLVRGFLERHGYKAVIGAHRKEAAVRAGLGAIGKNNLVLHPQLGAWVAYQSLVTDAPLEPDSPFTADLCLSCRACLDACPTGALYESRRVDPRRCVTSLLTSWDASEDQWPHFGNKILGCDDCLDACPRNQQAQHGPPPESLFPDGVGLNIPLRRLLRLDERAFRRELLRPVQSKLVRSKWLDRITRLPGLQTLSRVVVKTFLRGREVLPETFVHASGNRKVYQRNAIVAAGNGAVTALREDVERLREDPELAAAAAWALARIPADDRARA